MRHGPETTKNSGIRDISLNTTKYYNSWIKSMTNDKTNNILPFSLPHYYLPFTHQKVYYNTERRDAFTWEEMKILYKTYSRCGYLPTNKLNKATTKEKIAMLNFIMLCESNFVDFEKLIEKVESYSKWNKFTRKLLKCIQ